MVGFDRMSESKSSKSVLITGASSGIGEACVVELAQQGYRVFAGVRREEDAEHLRSQSTAVTPVHLDITQPEAIAKAVDFISRHSNEHGLFGLVNNAGHAFACPLEFLPLDRLRQQFEVNLIGQIAVTQAMLPLLRAGDGGRIVNMTSISANVSGPFVSPYSSSKHAFSAVNDSMRLEFRNFNIKVSEIVPADIKTPIWKKSRENAERLKEEMAAEGERNLPEAVKKSYEADGAAMRKATAKFAEKAIPASRVSKAVLHSLQARRPKTKYLVGGRAWAAVRLLRLLPDRLRDKIILNNLGMK